jgi:hypothetical protein
MLNNLKKIGQSDPLIPTCAQFDTHQAIFDSIHKNN